ncbi:MAG: YbaK/EbsC family protein [Desulfobacterales bacterium]|nr:YbaK/EbsC family protein [Desulfobacterales bacterium]
MTLEANIQQILSDNGVDYHVVAHEPVYTNPAMAEALQVNESETVKSLVLNTKEGDMIVMVLPGDRRVDWKRVARAAGSKKVSFAKPENVKDRVGCDVGCVPPFGHLTPMAVYMDQTLVETPYIYFNPGVHDKSYKISGKALKTLCHPVYV